MLEACDSVEVLSTMMPLVPPCTRICVFATGAAGGAAPLIVYESKQPSLFEFPLPMHLELEFCPKNCRSVPFLNSTAVVHGVLVGPGRFRVPSAAAESTGGFAALNVEPTAPAVKVHDHKAVCPLPPVLSPHVA